jgi:diguanylate cyclase (GGDEF)-like protein
MSEIAKRLEKAEKYLQKGKLSSALEEFREILIEDPANDSARQRAADICLSLNQDREAADHLSSLFDHYLAGSRTSEAANTYKKLIRLGPANSTRTLKYAQLIEKTSPRESLEAYRTAFQGLSKAGRDDEALLAIKKVVVLDPTAENYQLESDLAIKTGDNKSAATSLLQLARLHEKAGTESLPTFERAYALDAENIAVAMAYAHALLRDAKAPKAVEILQPFENATTDAQELFIQALLMANLTDRAEPAVLKLFDREPAFMPLVGEVMKSYLHKGQSASATELARQLQKRVAANGDPREFQTLIRDISDSTTAGIEFVEFLAQLYNTSNREHEYCETLLKLFQLHYAQRNYLKAADCLDRATEVDAYETGHQEKLDLLRGKIDANRFNTIASRLSGAGRTRQEQENQPIEMEQEKPEPKEPTVLEDLMLQAEIFLQYSMRSKAVERLERINKLFPREEDTREKLAQLFTAAGFTPKYEKSKPVPPPAAKGTAVGAGSDENAVDNFSRVTEITRNISRQSSVKSVLFATVNDVGRHWNVSRCVAGLCAPGKAPSAAMEYCATGVTKSDIMGLARLISNLQAQAVAAGGPISFEKAQSAPELEALRPVLQLQKIDSLMAVPLMDGEEPIGLIVLEQSGGTRSFRPVDEIVLNTIAEQVVLAVNNARLRSLVKTLAVTDEKSGLLRRSSYLDVLLSEVQRGLQQKGPITLVLINFGPAGALVKEVGEQAVEETMQEIGHAVTAHIRQNDVAVRYDLTNIALVLAETSEKNAFFVLDKLRKTVAAVRFPGHSETVVVTAGIAEMVMQPKFDPVDIVTEGINRVESALETARHEGGNRAHAIAPVIEVTAVTA